MRWHMCGMITLLVGALLIGAGPGATAQAQTENQTAAQAELPVAPQKNRPPNFIVFVADDLAWDDLGCYGHPSIRTPSIDSLATAGMRFDSAFLTCSSCSPSRTSMLTGRYPHQTGAAELHQPVPADQILFSQALRDAGYFTAVAGKWHLGPNVRIQFDLIRDGGGPGGEEQWVSTLTDRPKDRPFFLWLAAFDPHRDYGDNAIDPLHQPSDVRVPVFLPDTPTTRADLAAYYDEISRFDRYVGLVLEELERQGESDSTVVMVISDNGRPFPACKTRVTTNGVQTPLVVRWPAGLEPGQVSDSLVSTIDLAPTILELAGVSKDSTFQGESLAPILQDPEAEIREFAFAEHNWHDYRAFERAVISRDHLLILNEVPDLPATPPADAVRSPTYIEMLDLQAQGKLEERHADLFRVPRDREELFAWRDDPYCTENRISDPASAEQLAALRLALSDWQRETEDRFPGVDQLTPDKYDRRTGKLPER